MRALKSLAIAATLMAAATASTGSANIPPDVVDDEKASETRGGNAIDKATGAGTERPITGPGSLPPEGYAIIGDFLANIGTGAYWEAFDVINQAWKQPDDGSSTTFGYLAPIDGPAESVLDQLDERGTPLPMAGEPGSDATVLGAAPTPPPESILDFIDQPDSPPAPQPSEGADAAKPAANLAPRPAVAPPAPPP